METTIVYWGCIMYSLQVMETRAYVKEPLEASGALESPWLRDPQTQNLRAKICLGFGGLGFTGLVVERPKLWPEVPCLCLWKEGDLSC